MLHTEQLEELICIVSVLDRPTLIKQFQQFPATFPVDLTPDFLEELPIEQVRHIFLALCLQCRKLPRLEEDAVAA